ncbi:hypothetical protein [Pelagibacterium sp. H642]|uniref:hypothetical protein n=1 Tax=Pelagibacterium sp. H642 TaxID=1881069 RepID=UPI0028152141|nr:hypothetical protein [Pelagibacterium sp. H642]WMT91926.1 hypothetical protein NO934_06605 [Pelagibacterium sp. H642]
MDKAIEKERIGGALFCRRAVVVRPLQIAHLFANQPDASARDSKSDDRNNKLARAAIGPLNGAVLSPVMTDRGVTLTCTATAILPTLTAPPPCSIVSNYAVAPRRHA